MTKIPVTRAEIQMHIAVHLSERLLKLFDEGVLVTFVAIPLEEGHENVAVIGSNAGLPPEDLRLVLSTAIRNIDAGQCTDMPEYGEA
jgi:hypothetical protein